MNHNERQYKLIELRSGRKGICLYDKIGALEAAHDFNKIYPNERYAICAV